jgi:hypothetical protein
MMQLTTIPQEEYDQTEFKSTIDSDKLVLSIGPNNNMMISKKDIMHGTQIEINVNQLIFIVDQSGSMENKINNQPPSFNLPSYLPPPGFHISNYQPPPPLNLGMQAAAQAAAQAASLAAAQASGQVSTHVAPPHIPQAPEPVQEPTLLSVVSVDAVETNMNIESEYVKCVYKIPNMKSYQRIIFGMETQEFKGVITWTDNENNTQSMILTDMSKYNPINDPHVNEAINLANIIGHYINLATISNNVDRIGYFRKINQICKTHSKFFDDVTEKKLLTDFSLIELLFYNRKQAINLFESTLTFSQRNMERLLEGASSGGGHRMYAATATLSSVCGQTPSLLSPPVSQSGQTPGRININRDISNCSICFDNLREYIFSCGHCYACKTCAEKLLSSTPMNKCSYCKQTVSWIRKIALSKDQKNPEHYYKCISTDCYNIASIVSKCDDLVDDTNYHLTYCSKCFKQNMKEFKKSKISRNCFCSKEITKIMENIYFN